MCETAEVVRPSQLLAGCYGAKACSTDKNSCLRVESDQQQSSNCRGKFRAEGKCFRTSVVLIKAIRAMKTRSAMLIAQSNRLHLKAMLTVHQRENGSSVYVNAKVSQTFAKWAHDLVDRRVWQMSKWSAQLTNP